MRSLCLLSLAFSAATLPAYATAEPAAVSTAPAAAVLPLPQKQAPALRLLLKDLNLLLERGGELPQDKLDALAAETERYGAKVREAMGPKMLEDAARREEAARSAGALKALAVFREALQAYYAANGGKYPASPADLVPARLSALPELLPPGHDAPSSAATIIDSQKYDADVAAVVKDSGGWLYFASPASANYGLLLIDCTHRAAGGEEFYKY